VVSAKAPNPMKQHDLQQCKDNRHGTMRKQLWPDRLIADAGQIRAGCIPVCNQCSTISSKPLQPRRAVQRAVADDRWLSTLAGRPACLEPL
jgi:hypothetical protein